MLRRALLALLTLTVLVLAGGAYLAGIALDVYGEHEPAGTVVGGRIPAAVVEARAQEQREAARTLGVQPPSKQILFGDLHAHTTFSKDAFLGSLPVIMGEGAHPPADACDFARHCAALDFWGIADHAETLTPQHWLETKASIRQCNALAGDPADPDLVTFVGWEWTQVGRTPQEHYGHKNVLFPGTGEDELPARPIEAPGNVRTFGSFGLGAKLALPLLDFANRQRYFDLQRLQVELDATPLCPEGPLSPELPSDCRELAETPSVLYRKLAEWGFDSIVIPHGTAWGNTSPFGVDFANQLVAGQYDPDREPLIEVYSGHGNSEEYRSWRHVAYDAEGQPQCPEPASGFTPGCWRAGEIIFERCRAQGESESECRTHRSEAQANYLKAGKGGNFTVRGATIDDWGDSSQCRDCFLPAFDYRPGGSAQYALALANWRDPRAPLRFRFGLIGSSDNHSARPGTGYKELHRRGMSDGGGYPSKPLFARLQAKALGDRGQPTSRSVDPASLWQSGMAPPADFERATSFLTTGGLVAVHAEGRHRAAIWAALQRRQVYATSGPRILLWFDLLNAPGDDGGERTAAMGSEVVMSAAPRFRVRALGAHEQKPGCPPHAASALGPARLARLCRGECYHPSDQRHPITRVEVIRIRPQVRAGEAVAPLIEDPWRSFSCPSDPATGCVVEFEDHGFATDRRDALYYVRALQEPTPVINGGGLRCQYNEVGRCTEVHSCSPAYLEDPEDDCLQDAQQRAWSSPIFVDHDRSG